MKNSENTAASTIRRPIYTKWWFWIIIIAILAAIVGNARTNSDASPNASQNSSQTAAVDHTEPVSNSSVPMALSSEAETMCRALTQLFVENVVEEEWHMLAFSVESHQLDENGSGTIEVLYMPPNAGNGETKVNLSIEKNGDVYTITYALLAGINEVDLSTVSSRYKSLSK